MQRRVKEHDVVPPRLQTWIVEIPEAVVNTAYPLPGGFLSRISKRSRGQIERVDFAHDPRANCRSLEGSEAAAPGYAPFEGFASEDPPKPIERPFVLGPGDAPVDGPAAKRVRHPEGRIFGLLTVGVPIVSRALEVRHTSIIGQHKV